MPDLLNFDQIRARHTEYLRQVNATDVTPERIAKVQQFIETIRLSGQGIVEDDDREYLRSLLTFWGNWLYTQTRTYPNTNLEPASLDQPGKRPIPIRPSGEAQGRRVIIGGGILLGLIVVLLVGVLFMLGAMSLSAGEAPTTDVGVAETALAVNATTIIGVATDIAIEQTTAPTETLSSLNTPSGTGDLPSETPVVFPSETPTGLPPTEPAASPPVITTSSPIIFTETPTELPPTGGGGFVPPPVGIISVQMIEPQGGIVINAGEPFTISATYFNMQVNWRLFFVLTYLETAQSAILPESLAISEDAATGVMTGQATAQTPGLYSVGVYIATSDAETLRLQRWAESGELVTNETQYDGVILFRDLAVFEVR